MSEVKSSASVLAEARAEAANTAHSLDRANAEHVRVQSRVAAHQAERTAIIAASRRGDQDPQHALRLAVIDADLAELAPMILEAEAQQATAQSAAAAANQAVLVAEQQLERAKDRDLLARLIEHAAKLDGLILATLNEIAAIDKRTGRRPSWAPSPETYQVLTKLHLTRQAMR